MDNQAPPKALVSSFTLTVALGVLAILPVVRAPIPALSLETTAGQWLYGGSILVVAVLLLWANHREQRHRAWEQAQRDSKFAQGHQEIVDKMMGLSALQGAHYERLFGLLASTIPATDPRVQAVEQEIAATQSDLDKVAKVNLPRYIGYAPRVTVTAPDGTLLHDSDWVPPAREPSDPNSGEDAT